MERIEYPCGVECKNKTPDICSRYKECEKWRKWFSAQWDAAQRSALESRRIIEDGKLKDID